MAAPSRRHSIAPAHKPANHRWASAPILAPVQASKDHHNAAAHDRIRETLPEGRRLGCCRYRRGGRRLRARPGRRSDRWKVLLGTRSQPDMARLVLPGIPRGSSSPRCRCTGPCRPVRPCNKSLQGTGSRPPVQATQDKQVSTREHASSSAALHAKHTTSAA